MKIKKIVKQFSILPKILVKFGNIIVSIIKTLTRGVKQTRKIGLFASLTKKRVFRVKNKTVAFYKRPMRDISHVSIIIIIIITLFSGVSASFGTEDRVVINPFESQKVAGQAFQSQTEEKLLEADSVATLSAIYSDDLGQDASKVAETLNNKINVASASSDYLTSVPIVAMSGTETRSAITKYVVQGGDTVWSIANKFNITTDTIRYNNKLEDENSVKPGQTLVILPVSGVLHTVGKNDTLAGISARYKVSEALIVSQNDLYGEDIKAGMQLIIPNGEIPEAPKPKVTEPTTRSNSSNYGGSYGSSDRAYATGRFLFPTSADAFYNGYHYWAIDITGDCGQPVWAADSGRIIEAQYGWNGGYGNTILIDHGNGYQTRYAHMTRLALIGGYVRRGQVIGYMGSTGRSTGCHLHFEIQSGGARLNPMRFF